MTSKEMREMRRECYSYLEILNAAIDRGMEFPDAIQRMAPALDMDGEMVEELKRDYDECC